MSHPPPTELADDRPGWHQYLRAFLGGLVVASAMFFVVAAVQTPELDPPPETVAVFVVAATAGTVSYLLLDHRPTAGYATAALTGGYVLLEVALVVAGVYGPAGPETNPLGPIIYVVLAVAVVLTAALSWRGRERTDAPLETSSRAG
jgi:peptidoglycan/LPS O-acetylase OafA/YrhL